MNEELNEELLYEQKSVDEIYRLFDFNQKIAKERLDKIYATRSSSVFSAVYERDAFATYFENLLSIYKHAENRLVFGKLVYESKINPAEYYIGRIGLVDNDASVKLVDWRSPSGEDFYQATREENLKISLRRHILLKGRNVDGIEDEVLDSNIMDKQLQVSGEGALFMEMSRSRGKYMRDIIATIQKEQDVIIRSPLSGALIIQGGPGTGKTAVALHRIAYLLYAYKDVLVNSGILIIGPSNAFLNYIDKVLPSLGEIGTTSCTIDKLSAFKTTRIATNKENAIKGSINMTKFLKKAVEGYINYAEYGIKVRLGEDTYIISHADINEHIKIAKNTGRKYARSRKLFVKSLLEHVVNTQVSGNASLDEKRKYVMRELRGSDIVRLGLNLAWMPLTPEYLLRKLLTSRIRLENASCGILSKDEIDYMLSLSSEKFEFSNADLPLLDEVSYLIGLDDERFKKYEKQYNSELKDAQRFTKRLLKNGGILQDTKGFVDKNELAMRNFIPEVVNDLEELDTFDRRKFKHIVVDEAQELSPMQWRMIARRSLNNSYTIVGDIFQTSSSTGIGSKEKNTSAWNKLSKYISCAVNTKELTINYRNTKEISELAETIAIESGLKFPNNAETTIKAPRSIANSVRFKQVADIYEEIQAEVINEIIDKNTAVITPENMFETVKVIVQNNCYTPRQVKGLEFDKVILVEPSAILQVSPSDLYVALTRATTQLTIVHTTADAFFTN
ncbi:MAG: UvrD-helicase domain-containing protein [Candidatus Ancillula sp.]|jgi:DNA helicase IV|nr:UvrD-helicase domain-containing protein [Candidatus Ancillula sp.]